MESLFKNSEEKKTKIYSLADGKGGVFFLGSDHLPAMKKEKAGRTNEAVAKVSNEYGWSAGDKKGFMLDDEGMEKSDKDNIERYLKALGIMK